MKYQVVTLQPGTYQSYFLNVSGGRFVPLDTAMDGMTVRFSDPKADPITIGSNGAKQFRIEFAGIYLDGVLSAKANLLIADCAVEVGQVAEPLNPAPAELDAIAGTAVVDSTAGSLHNPAVMVGGFSPAGFTPRVLNLDQNGMAGVSLDGAAAGAGQAGLRSLNASNALTTGSGEWSKALMVAGQNFGGNPIAGGVALNPGQTVNLNTPNVGRGFRRLKVYFNISAPGLVLEAQYNQAPHTGAWIMLMDGATAGALPAGEYAFISDGTVNGTSEALNAASVSKLQPAPCMSQFQFRVRNAGAAALTLTWLQWEAEAF